MIGISRSIQPNWKQNKHNLHKEKNTAEAKHQSSPITLRVHPEWCLVSIKEWSSLFWDYWSNRRAFDWTL